MRWLTPSRNRCTSVEAVAGGDEVADRQRFETIRQSELRRLETKLGPLSPEARALVDEVTRLIVEKLLVEPTEQLKALPDEETQLAYTEAVNRLFRLRVDSADPVSGREP